MLCDGHCTMRLPRFFPLALAALSVLLTGVSVLAAEKAAATYEAPETPPHLQYQYKFGSINILPANADEPKRAEVSTAAAKTFIENAAAAWTGGKQCVSCHTNGTYLAIRPSLSAELGLPREEERAFAVKSLAKLETSPRKSLQRGTTPASLIYIAAGLAEWDARITQQLSSETERALQLMLEIQRDSGTWGAADCWPPFESSAFQEATVAAMAIGTAPGWLAKQEDPSLLERVDRLKNYLRTAKPPEDYDRCLLLWADARLPGLLEPAQRQKLIELVFTKQQSDGGWSIRTFGQPEEWGKGNRAKKLRSEPEYANPPSDGHQTGLAIILLRESGVSADDPHIVRGVAWLKSNQRDSGRWWTRSLNTDRWHFINYSGTMYPLRALALCNALPKLESAKSR